MVPPPLTTLHVPPAGEPTRAFVPDSHMAVVVVVFTATLFTFTVKVLSAVVAGHPPFAGMVYRTVTLVLAVIFAGV